MDRRSFLQTSGAIVGSGLTGCNPFRSSEYVPGPDSITLNDVHSQLNPTVVDQLLRPSNRQALQQAIQKVSKDRAKMSFSGSRHAMGGQQFGTGTVNLDLRGLNRVLSFDKAQGLLTLEAGIQWPAVIKFLRQNQAEGERAWSIVQKQTGADNLTIGGSLAVNAHGRGTQFKPFVQDINSFRLMMEDGEVKNVSRSENPELFKLVIGGYGLFGAVSDVTLRLMPRTKLLRHVEVIELAALEEKAEQRIQDGYLYGDFQYKTDSSAKDFMRTGVFSCYKPVPDDAPAPKTQKRLSAEQWNKLLYLAFAEKGEAWRNYSSYYLTTNGQYYWSDTHQLGYYNPEYHSFISNKNPALKDSTLMITELYCPARQIEEFTLKLAAAVKRYGLDVVYGTMRMIRADDETFLPWAKEDFACVIFNLRVEKTPAGIERAKREFQYLIDVALEFGGSYFLTYHRYARREQVLAAYPEFPAFLAAKEKYDRKSRIETDWYRHYRKMLG